MFMFVGCVPHKKLAACTSTTARITLTAAGKQQCRRICCYHVCYPLEWTMRPTLRTNVDCTTRLAQEKTQTCCIFKLESAMS